MIAIQLENNVVINFIEVENITDVENCVEYQDGVSIGDTYEEGVFTPAPVVLPPIVILPVSPRQIRQAMNRVPLPEMTLREAVEAAIAASDQDTKDWYEFATEFDRYHFHVLMLADDLGVSEEDLDNLWLLAASL